MLQKHSPFFKFILGSVLAFAVASQIGCIAFLEDPQQARETPLSAELLALLAAGNGGTEFGTPQGGGEAGAEGTVLRSQDGRFSVTIPAGAMQEGDTEQFSIMRYNLSSEALPNGFLPVSYVYQVTPSYAFRKKVRITMSVDESEVSANNLDLMGTRGFSYSTTATAEDTGRVAGWEAFESDVASQEVRFETRTFSLFGAGSPTPGNHAPVIAGAFYYFKPGCSYLPYRVRAQVIEPDGNTMNVYLNNGPASGGTNMVAMTREGSTDWYTADLFYESMDPGGIHIQVVAVDDQGAATHRPDHGAFLYPDDAGNPVYESGYDRDQDNDGLLCAWEVDQGRDDQNPGDASGNADTDADGIPDVSDHTPNGESNPQIDTLTIYPEEASLEIGEAITLGIQASYSGESRFVDPNVTLTGNALNGSPVGALTENQFEAHYPGVAGVQAIINSYSATASVRVLDTLSPQNITDLSANSYSHTAIQLQWTAPGNDGPHGTASGYQVRLSNTPITNTAECTAAVAVSHTVTPSTAGITERLEVNGLSPDQEYYFCVLAYDSEGNFNDWVQGELAARTQTVPDLSPPSSVSDLVAVAIDPDKIRLTWTAVGDDGTTGAASAYEIRRSASPITNDVECSNAVYVSNSLVSEPQGTPMTLDVSNLADGTVYYFCVRAFDEANNRSSWTGSVTATTPTGNEAPIADAGSDGLAGTGQLVQLDGSSSSDPDAALCGATDGLYSYSWTFLSLPPTSTLNDSDLINRTSLQAQFVPDVSGTYVLQFSFTDDAGSCAGGNRTDVDTVTYEVTDLTPPSNVEVALLQDGIELTWDPVVSADEYRIYYGTSSPVSTSDIMVATSDLITILTDGFTDDTTYYFAVTSAASGDESELSDEVSVVLPDTICNNALVEFPEKCDDGDSGIWDGCDQCQFQIGFSCVNTGGTTTCSGVPLDLGTYGVGDFMSPEIGPALAIGEQKHYYMTITESVSLSMNVTANTGNPDLLIGACEGDYTDTYRGSGNESLSNVAFAPGCYVVSIEAASALPNGFTINLAAQPP